MSKFKRAPKPLPKKIALGYCNWGESDDKIFQEVEHGLNVIIWFSVNLATDPNTQKAIIQGGPNYDEVAKIIKKIKDHNYDVVHLLSVGGWNSPHPSTKNTAEEFYDAWIEFNERISKPELDFYGFDGVDWDIEGNDDMSSPYNHFTFAELDLMGKFSQMLKDNDFIVSMAPSESYIDYRTNEYSLDLTFIHEEWKPLIENFNYHGKNVYTYLIKKYEKTPKGLDTFDFYSIQLYEGYSHAQFDFKHNKIPFGIILRNIYENYCVNGYEVDFTMEKDSGLDKSLIKLDPNKLVIGLANAWADGVKFLFLSEDDIISGYNFLVAAGGDVRGFMYWDIADEGKVHPDDPLKRPFYMSMIFNKIFHTRNDK